MCLQEIERLLKETQQSVEKVAELTGMSVHQVVNAVCNSPVDHPLTEWFEAFRFLPPVVELTVLNDQEPGKFKVHGWDLFHERRKRVAFFLPAADYSQLSCTPGVVLSILKQVHTVEQAERDSKKSQKKIDSWLREAEKLHLESEERLALARRIANLEI